MLKTVRVERMWKVLCFLVCLFFSVYIYNSNTNSLIKVGVHLIKKKQRVLVAIHFLDWFDSFFLNIWHFFFLKFFFHVKKCGLTHPNSQPDWPNLFLTLLKWHFLSDPFLTYNLTPTRLDHLPCQPFKFFVRNVLFFISFRDNYKMLLT